MGRRVGELTFSTTWGTIGEDKQRPDPAEVAMATITISLPEDRATRLRDFANRLRVTPEELVRVSVDDLLSRPEDAFERAVERVLSKNAELYRRLA